MSDNVHAKSLETMVEIGEETQKFPRQMIPVRSSFNPSVTVG
jgi:hypothetical protein